MLSHSIRFSNGPFEIVKGNLRRNQRPDRQVKLVPIWPKDNDEQNEQ